MFCTSLARQFDPARATVAALPHPAYSARLRTTSHVDPQRGGYRKYFKQAATHLSALNLELVHSPLAAGGKCFLTKYEKKTWAWKRLSTPLQHDHLGL